MYYGLLSGLPDLKPLQSLPLDVNELRFLCLQYLHPQHEKLFHHFFYQIDLINYNAQIQHRNGFLNGGNLSLEAIDLWVNKNVVPSEVFLSNNLGSYNEEATQIEKLQNYWETYYAHLQLISDGMLQNFIDFEISFKNFFKRYAERRLNLQSSEHYIQGGHFDRFAYDKLLIGDIQAEFPFLAQVLASFEIEDPQERELKIIEAKWKYYDYISFFDGFSFKALYAWLCKYLDVLKWQQNDAKLGQKNMALFQQSITQKTQEQWA